MKEVTIGNVAALEKRIQDATEKLLAAKTIVDAQVKIGGSKGIIAYSIEGALEALTGPGEPPEVTRYNLIDVFSSKRVDPSDMMLVHPSSVDRFLSSQKERAIQSVFDEVRQIAQAIRIKEAKNAGGWDFRCIITVAVPVDGI